MKNDEAVSPVIATILMVAITVVLAGVLYVWANELASNQTDVGTLNSYSATDHPADTTTGDGAGADGIAGNADDTPPGDALLRVAFGHGPDDLQWAFLTMTLFDEEDGQTYKCSPGGDKCGVTEETADSVWGGTEIISLDEAGTDICGASGAGGDEGSSCEVKLTIQYKGKTVAGSTVPSII